jgi:DsbC/DsbD-like thiol-disulfide interchange protein
MLKIFSKLRRGRRSGTVPGAAGRRALLCVAAVAGAAVVALGQAGAPAVVSLSAPPVQKLATGATSKATITVAVQPGYHINSNRPNSEYLIPTSLSLDSPAGFELERVAWPAPHDRKLTFSAEPISLFEGKFPVALYLKPKPGVKGDQTVTAKLRYQACNDQLCRPPTTATVAFKVDVARGGR